MIYYSDNFINYPILKLRLLFDFMSFILYYRRLILSVEYFLISDTQKFYFGFKFSFRNLMEK